VRAGAGGALIELGGYCRLELAPDSVVRLSGAQRQESVFLEEGMVACEVDRNVGGFAVETEFCTVSALGTRFVVQLRRKGGEAETPRKEAYVRVLAGAALVSYPWGQDLLVAR
jgi:ferric-dicitrate binding protein FerR (iron transport regulator)